MLISFSSLSLSYNFLKQGESLSENSLQKKQFSKIPVLGGMPIKSAESSTNIDNVDVSSVEQSVAVAPIKVHRSAPPLPKTQDNEEVVQIHEAYVPQKIINEQNPKKLLRSAPPIPSPTPPVNENINDAREPFVRRDFPKPVPLQRRSLELPADYDYESENAITDPMTDPLPTKGSKSYDSDRSSVYSNSSNSYRKSVSFDLGNNEYKPVYEVDKQAVKSKFNIEDRLNKERDNYYSPRTPDDHYNNNFKYEPVLSTGKSHYSNQDPTKVYVREGSVEKVRGILRSPSPKIETREQITSVVKSRREKVAYDEEEIDQENPFREEVLANAQDNANGNKLRRPVSMYDTKQYQPLYGNESLTKSNDNLFEEDTQQKKIPIKIPLYQSTGAINNNSNKQYPSHNRPIVAPKPFTKHADLVRNEGVVLMEQERAKGDYVEYMHNRETNQIIEVFPDNIPLPPPPSNQTKIPIRRNMSVDRPKESPPPPPPMIKSPVPPFDMTKVELVPARFEMRPVPSRPEFIRKSPEADVILVTEDVHRQILLEENDIRNARQTERELEEERTRNQRLYEENLRMRSQIQNSKIPITTYTQSAHTHPSQPPPLPPSVPPPLPPPQVVPIQMTQLPIPQQTGYYQFIPSNAPLQFNYPPQAAFAPYGSVVGSYLVSETQNTNQSIQNAQHHHQNNHELVKTETTFVTNSKQLIYQNGVARPVLDLTNSNLPFETIPIRVMQNNSMPSPEIVPVSPSATSFGKI